MDNEEEKRFMRMTKAELVDHIKWQEDEIRERDSYEHLPIWLGMIGVLAVLCAVTAIPIWLFQ